MNIRESSVWLKQLIKFNLIGGINTLLTYIVFSFVFALSGSELLGLIGDYSFGIVFSFFANRYFTFKISEGKMLKEFAKMVASYIILFILNYYILDYIKSVFSLNIYISQFISLIFVVLISFVVQKFFIFAQHDH
ncbi:GtrA family protein [Spirochaeta cellobiosiphila]|uniref:GtrA family protein n=1 Tax=Spirochaeta cellobiosiphila TaxID=504483 RepID=UPI0003F8B7CF|nr:GtrA family protein [Spirochaeta cellobiosiphila]